MKRLILLDLNNVLIQNKTPKKGAHFLLDQLNKVGDLAIYTSTREDTAKKYVEKLGASRFNFCLYRHNTCPDPDIGKNYITFDKSWENFPFENIKHSYATIKNLQQVLFFLAVNSIDNSYNLDNIFILDDTPEKLRFNKRQNCILIEKNRTYDNNYVREIIEKINRGNDF